MKLFVPFRLFPVDSIFHGVVHPRVALVGVVRVHAVVLRHVVFNELVRSDLFHVELLEDAFIEFGPDTIKHTLPAPVELVQSSLVANAGQISQRIHHTKPFAQLVLRVHKAHNLPSCELTIILFHRETFHTFYVSSNVRTIVKHTDFRHRFANLAVQRDELLAWGFEVGNFLTLLECFAEVEDRSVVSTPRRRLYPSQRVVDPVLPPSDRWQS